MAIPTREQAISTLDDGQAALEALVARLSDQELTRSATIGGGEWSAKDLLGHIAFWEELAGETLADWRAGRRPRVEDISAAGQEGVDAANAGNQARTAAQSLDEVRSRAATAHTAIVQAIAGVSDEEWSVEAPAPTARRATIGERLGRILGGEPERYFGHAFDHLPDLEAYVASLGR